MYEPGPYAAGYGTSIADVVVDHIDFSLVNAGSSTVDGALAMMHLAMLAVRLDESALGLIARKTSHVRLVTADALCRMVRPTRAGTTGN